MQLFAFRLEAVNLKILMILKTGNLFITSLNIDPFATGITPMCGERLLVKYITMASSRFSRKT